MPIDRCSLWEKPTATVCLSEKPKNRTSNNKAEKEFRSNPHTRQLTATWFAHPKTYHTPAEGVEFQGRLKVGNKVFTAGRSSNKSYGSGKMYVVKLANTAGTKKKKYLLQIINQLQRHRKKTILESSIQAHIC